MLELLLIGTELLDDYYGALPRYYHELFEALGRLFAERGARLARVGIVPDDTTAIVDWLETAAAHGTDLVITIGGLGPTPDDVTKAAICAYFDDELAAKPAALASTRAFFERKFGTVPPLEGGRLKMASVPSRSTVLPSKYGAAPGFYIAPAPSPPRCGVIGLPGVTTEAVAILEASGMEYLPRDDPEDWHRVIFRLHQVPEVELAPIFDRAERAFPVRLGTYLEKDARGAFTRVRVVLKGPRAAVDGARALIEREVEGWRVRTDRLVLVPIEDGTSDTNPTTDLTEAGEDTEQ